MINIVVNLVVAIINKLVFPVDLSSPTCTIGEFETFSFASGFESNSSFECFGGSFLGFLLLLLLFLTFVTDFELEEDSLALSAEKMRREP